MRPRSDVGDEAVRAALTARVQAIVAPQRVGAAPYVDVRVLR